MLEKKITCANICNFIDILLSSLYNDSCKLLYLIMVVHNIAAGKAERAFGIYCYNRSYSFNIMGCESSNSSAA